MYRQQSFASAALFIVLVLGVESYYFYPPHYFYGPQQQSFNYYPTASEYYEHPVPSDNNAHLLLQRTKSQEISSNNLSLLDLERQTFRPFQSFLVRLCANTNSCPSVAAPTCQSCPSCPATATCPAAAVAPPATDAITTSDGVSASPKGTIKFTTTSTAQGCGWYIMTFSPYTKITVNCDNIGNGLVLNGDFDGTVDTVVANTDYPITGKIVQIQTSTPLSTNNNPTASCSWTASV